MNKYLKIYKSIIVFAISQTVIFRGAFVIFALWLLIDALLKILFFAGIFSQIPQINGWTFTDTLFLVYILSLAWDCMWLLYLSGFDRFVENFRQGEFDFTLLKPVHPLLYITLTGFSPSSISISRILILIYIILFIPFGWNLNNIILSLTIFIPGIIAMHGLYAIVAASAFWLSQALPVLYFIAHIIDGSRYPISIFPPILRFIFTFILPIMLIANFPVMALKGMIGWESVWLVLAIAVIFELLAYYIWNLGIKRYSSASS